MKTSSNSKVRIVATSSIVLLFAVFFLFMTRCQKEEIPVPANDIASSNTMRPSPIVKETPLPMILIEHMTMRSKEPEYDVAIFANGNIVFTGRKNTFLIGEQRFTASLELIRQLNDMYKKSGLFTDFPEKGEGSGSTDRSTPSNNIDVSDLPFTLTTFNSDPNRKGVTLRDDNNYPDELISLRNITEKYLTIDQYIYGKK